MKISTTTDKLDQVFGLQKAIDILAEAGYDALDFSNFRPEHYTDVHDENFYKEMRKYAEDKGLYFNQSHAPFPSSFVEEDKTEQRFQDLVIAMRNASLLGVRNIIVHPMQHLTYCKEDNPEKLFEDNMKFYRSLIPYCEEYNIKVACENMWQYTNGMINHSVCSRAWEFTKYLDTLDSEWIVACLDIGHANLVRENPDEFIRTLGSKCLKCLHVHDVDGTQDSHTLPFFGVGDWDKIMKALADIDYEGEITFEADSFMARKPVELLPDCAKYMAAVGRCLADKFEAYKKA